MTDTYLTAAFKDREQVKALGARWDSARKQWYVLSGRDVALFARWLPADDAQAPAPLTGSTCAELTLPALNTGSSARTTTGSDLTVAGTGMALSQLLAGVAAAVAQAYQAGAWTMVEVVKADARKGMVYLELAERDANGTSIAQARGMIWADAANRIVPAFERATGVILGAGIKLLVRARPTTHPLYGMSLVIDAIDPDYTLGDLEARKREIRTRLQREGLFDLNRTLPQPWDYNDVLVVAPQGAAGLGDFQAEAARLERFGICAFTYVHSRFQGQGAAAEIRHTLLEAMGQRRAMGSVLPDAVVIIRGGGAVNDLAWLNDYDLARCICELDVPVFTGIGHERDNTVLDEVAYLRFDTPSKVIVGIEQVIARRVSDAKVLFDAVITHAARCAQSTRREVEQADAAVRAGTSRNLALAKEHATALFSEVRVGAARSIRNAADASRDRMFDVRHHTMSRVAEVKQAVPALLSDVRAEARQAIRSARTQTLQDRGAVLERSAWVVRQGTDDVDAALRTVATASQRIVVDARSQSESLMREVAGQGPEKTLGRGFTIVRSAGGSTWTSARAVSANASIEIQFHDGKVAARTEATQERQGT